MTSVIHCRVQFEDEIAALKTEVTNLKVKVSSSEEEIKKLHAELDSQKETFRKTSEAVNEHTVMKDSNKRILAL